MKIRTKLIALVLSVIVAMGIISMSISISSIKRQADAELAATRANLLDHKKEMLKIVLDNAYAVIETAHKEANDPQKVIGIIKNKLKNAVDLAIGALETIDQQDDLYEDEQQKMGLEMLGDLRYERDNYFWVVTTVLIMLSDPKHPDWVGKDISKLEDTGGNRIFPNLLEVGKSEGEAYFDYMWTAPGSDEPASKIAYARLFRP